MLSILRYSRFPYLSTEAASVLGVLGDFDLLHHLTQGSTITGTVFTGDSDLLCTLGLLEKRRKTKFWLAITHKHNPRTEVGGHNTAQNTTKSRYWGHEKCHPGH